MVQKASLSGEGYFYEDERSSSLRIRESLDGFLKAQMPRLEGNLFY